MGVIFRVIIDSLAGQDVTGAVQRHRQPIEVPSSRSRATDSAVSIRVCSIVSGPISAGTHHLSGFEIRVVPDAGGHLDRWTDHPVRRPPIGVERIDDRSDVAGCSARGVRVTSVSDNLHLALWPESRLRSKFCGIWMTISTR